MKSQLKSDALHSVRSRLLFSENVSRSCEAVRTSRGECTCIVTCLYHNGNGNVHSAVSRRTSAAVGRLSTAPAEVFQADRSRAPAPFHRPIGPWGSRVFSASAFARPLSRAEAAGRPSSRPRRTVRGGLPTGSESAARSLACGWPRSEEAFVAHGAEQADRSHACVTVASEPECRIRLMAVSSAASRPLSEM